VYVKIIFYLLNINSIYLYIKVSSSDLQRFVFGERYSIIEQDHSVEPTPAKRLKSTISSEENEEVRSKNMKKYTR
jgi:hypothetical protein